MLKSRPSTFEIGPAEPTQALLRILLIEDDEDDYVLIKDLLSGIPGATFTLDWAPTYESGVNMIRRCEHHVYLLDYRLGFHDGLEVLEAAREEHCSAPIIFLTGHGKYELDVRAMRAGAADYLIKDELNAPLLERSIRYAVQRNKIEETLRESEEKYRRLSARLLTAQEDERNRIARDLHDGTCQRLGLMKMILDKAIRRERQGFSTLKTLEGLSPLLLETIEDIRRTISDLRPSILDDLGIVPTINWLCREFEETHRAIHVDKRIPLHEREVPEHLKVTIYRVVQEALNNVAKHSGGSTVQVSLHKVDDTLALSIEDNGLGFEPTDVMQKEDAGRGVGLGSMRERVELSGGTFALTSARGGGTTVRALWPSRREMAE
jgi:signal transduction histidine kinase